VTRRRLLALACAAAFALAWPATVVADHLRPTATVSAAVTERTGDDTWRVDIRWQAGCQGASEATDNYDGHLYMVDLDTGERTYVGGVVSASGVRDTRELAAARARHLRPELEITCFVAFPQHGAGYSITVTGNPVTIPARFGGGGGAGGCRVAVLGTNGPDALTGGAAGDVMIGFAADDRMRGEGGHDCLVGGAGADRMTGGDGADRLVGGRGRDTLVGGPGANAYDAGGGDDVVRARNGTPESVRCGAGRDRAYVDRRDRVRGCELSLVGVGR
jgi:Ca2+-binding RTX toxin-like protein